MVSEQTSKAYMDLLRRLYSTENYERRCALYNPNRSDDEERIWVICSKFWPQDGVQQTFVGDQQEVNPSLDDMTARRYISELKQLLDKLNWD